MWQYNYDNQTLNYLMHKDHKYISKHKSKNGKWVYRYTESASNDYSTHIFGKTTYHYTPKTEVYGRNGKQIFTKESTVSTTSVVPFSNAKNVTTRKKYITYGTKDELTTIKGFIEKNNFLFNEKCIFADRCSNGIEVCCQKKPVFSNGYKCHNPVR